MVRGGAAGRQFLCVLLSARSRVLGTLGSQRLQSIVLPGMVDRRSSNSGADASFARRWMSEVRVNRENGVQAEIMAFKRGVAVEEAVTPPSSWYTSPEILKLELEKVFERRWLAVGRVEQLQSPGDFFTGKKSSVGRVRYVVCMDEQGTLRAFHNVCRHRAAAVATGSGSASSFVCPYHGWTYGLDGKLQKASRLGGIRNFSARVSLSELLQLRKLENGLSPLRASTWGPFVLISLPSKEANVMQEKELLGSVAKAYAVEKEWLGSAAKLLTGAKIDSSLQHVVTQEYILNCNWKVFCDNYLDGGYHVPHAHTGLTAGLNLKSYNTTLSEKVSIQSCRVARTNRSKGDESVGEWVTYAFVYPNFMINRYGPWMDTNLVLPITAYQCRVIFNYFLESSYPHDEAVIKERLKLSDIVQQEDISLCEAVQNGLQSPAYKFGRYAPNVEYAMHHFHTLLHEDLSGDSETYSGMDLEDLQQVLLRHPLS